MTSALQGGARQRRSNESVAGKPVNPVRIGERGQKGEAEIRSPRRLGCGEGWHSNKTPPPKARPVPQGRSN